MKKTILSIISTTLLTVSYGQSKTQADAQAIKQMCGCYEVQFNFAETFVKSPDANYKPSPVKTETALEWIELIEDQPHKIVLQHLLITGPTEESIVKHWRQDWLYENTDFLVFDKDQHWKYKKLPQKEVKGQWTQKVYQVDDSPRYEGTATWVHIDGRHFWQNTTDAPLPRREHTIRKDYNVLNRTNTHEITPTGWIHNQDNIKINRNLTDIQIAQEKGYDIYTKVPNEKCILAQTYWEKNASFWQKVRNKWQTEFDKKTDITIHKQANEKPLFMTLFELNNQSTTQQINTLIDTYLKK